MRKLIATLLLSICATPAMAEVCVVGVYGGVPGVVNGPVQVALTLLDTMTATFTASSVVATSATSTTGVMPQAAAFVRVRCTGGDAYFKIGGSAASNPTATTGDQIVSEDIAEYFGITPGEKIAFIQVL